ncbi:uncharacterized protein B0I36DRAFT_137551 [Microdochium trichocladiopsis]|uniref:Infection structure specific protein n=1 Tax=Microdochium trichocladiopsis TaxID=1682393 RepID=A0A9P8Y1F2_9PEZI|nr:uncharacterized protein B0I36DRAFT_137551 [Microdochium trichocladiopsis]KAH7027346.1 hypothetical protein B0I36DRAFT_137551 [Microdochium trichocladiopsis]
MNRSSQTLTWQTPRTVAMRSINVSFIMAVAGLASTGAALDAAHAFAQVGAVATTVDDGQRADRASCTKAFISVASGLPTPTGALSSWLADQDVVAETATTVDACATPSVPAPLTSAFSSYTAAITSWYSASSSAADSLVSECSTIFAVSLLGDALDALDAASASCGFGAPTTAKPAAAPRATAGAVMAAAGAVGAAILF